MGRTSLQFGDFLLDLGSGEFAENGRAIELARLPRRLLCYLARNRHRTVSREELLEEVWAGVAVEESALHQAMRQVRRAVRDDGRRQAVLKTEIGVGYRFAAASLERRAGAARARPAYVGRARLRRELESCLESAAAGRGGVVLLAGEPGMGKSRTCEGLADFAAQRGVLGLHGGGSPRAGAPPFWPWIEVVRELAGSRPVGALRRAAPAFLDLAPPAGAPEFDEAAVFRQFDMVKRCLHRAAELGPMLVVLEDVHEASAATLALLAFVARGAERSPLLLVATYREPELGRDRSRARVLAELAALGPVRSYELAALGETEASCLVEQHGRRRLPPDLVCALARASQGNPFFAVELARFFADGLEAGRITPAEAPGPGAGVRAWEPWIPLGARRLLDGRLAALAPGTRRCLDAAAVVGVGFDVALLRRVVPEVAIRAALEEAVALRLVVEADALRDAHRFSHALIRDALYEDLVARQPEALRGIHLAIAEALAADAGADREAQAAFHFCRAASRGGVERAVAFARRAAARASAMGDADAALDLYRRAGDLLRGDTARPRLRCELLVDTGEVAVRGPHLDEARGVLADALALARELDDAALFCRAALAYAYRSATASEADPHVVSLLEEGLERLGDAGGPLRAQVMARLAREVRYEPQGLPRALGLVDRALDDARRSGDALASARVLEDTTYARWSGDDPEGWLALNEEIVVAATRAGDAELRFRGLKGLATGYLELGDLEAAGREVARCSQAAEEHPSPYLRQLAENMRGAQAFRVGDFEAGERSALATGASGLAAAQPAAAAQLYYHRLETGRVDELEGAVRALVAGSPAVRAWRFALARLLVDEGRLDEAGAAIARAGDLAAIPQDRNWLIGMALLAECLPPLREPRLGRELFGRLRPYARLNVVLGDAALFYGNAAHFLGLLAAADGRDDEAHALLDDAMAMHERMQSAPWIVRTQLARAELLARGGEPERARRLAAGVGEPARSLGMPRIAARARALAGKAAASGSGSRVGPRSSLPGTGRGPGG